MGSVSFEDFEQQEAGPNLVSFRPATTEVESAGPDGKLKKEWKDTVFITVRIPGDQTLMIDREYKTVEEPSRDGSTRLRALDPDDESKYGKQFKRWLERRDDAKVDGMPVAELPGVHASQVETLKSHGCLSVEQLAASSESNLNRIGPGYATLGKKAQLYLKRKEENAPLEEIAKFKSDTEARQLVLEDENERLKARLAELEAESTKKASKSK